MLYVVFILLVSHVFYVVIHAIVFDNEEDRHRSDGGPHKDLPDNVQVTCSGYLLNPPSDLRQGTACFNWRGNAVLLLIQVA